MKRRFILACLISFVATMSPLVHSQVISATDATKFKTKQLTVVAAQNTAAVNIFFIAQAFDTSNATEDRQIFVSVSDRTTGDSWFIGCNNPSNNFELSVNEGNGNAILKATLDHTDPNCFSNNVILPVVIDLAGISTGNLKDSANERHQSIISGVKSNFTVSSDLNEVTFSGSMGNLNLPLEGNPLTGQSSISKKNETKLN